MSKKKLDRVKEELQMDMTPMIDCVFLLMIFFVLVIDLSQQDLEDLILPKAQYAVPDEKPPQSRPVVNIAQDGRVIFKKNVWFDPLDASKANLENVKKLMVHFKDFVVDPKSIKPETISGRVMTVIDDPMLIRADKWTEWHYIGKFMENCTSPEAAFWKLELAMSEEDKELKMLQKQRAQK
jgi:biopolymer transport protein ExbD